MKKFIEWSEEYKIGEKLIDSQHKHLFDIINTLHEGRHDPAIQKRCLEALKVYAIQHFYTEEDVMRAYGYPEKEIELHQKEHERFTVNVNNFCMAVADGETVLMDAVMNFLRKWIAHHVLESDRDLIPYLTNEI